MLLIGENPLEVPHFSHRSILKRWDGLIDKTASFVGIVFIASMIFNIEFNELIKGINRHSHVVIWTNANMESIFHISPNIKLFWI
jgi:hypothetical protein